MIKYVYQRKSGGVAVSEVPKLWPGRFLVFEREGEPYYMQQSRTQAERGSSIIYLFGHRPLYALTLRERRYGNIV